MNNARCADEVGRRFPRSPMRRPRSRAGHVLVGGRIVTNPASMVSAQDSIVVRPPTDLRGSAKLAAALDRFGVAVDGRAALDVGATAGGFTSVLLGGTARVYAVDAGHGQLLGSLRQDERVVNLESTNVGDLARSQVPEPVAIVTIDVSYLSLAAAIRSSMRSTSHGAAT